MRTFYDAVGELLRRRPSEWGERMTPWIIVILGTVMLGIMAYAWWTGEW